jgi:hypothetical protein
MEKCPNCGNHKTLEMHVYQKYAHVFWIPFFPIGKTAVSECNYCKHVLKLRQMPDSLSRAYHNLKGQTKTPLWTFSGLVLLAVLITVGVVSDRKNNEKNARLISSPKSGDVFEVKTKENQYTLYKVEDIEGDSALVRINQYETNRATGLADLKTKGESAYSDDLYSFSKTELRIMLENGEILDVERK